MIRNLKSEFCRDAAELLPCLPVGIALAMQMTREENPGSGAWQAVDTENKRQRQQLDLELRFFDDNPIRGEIRRGDRLKFTGLSPYQWSDMAKNGLPDKNSGETFEN